MVDIWSIFDLLQPACLCCGLSSGSQALFCAHCREAMPWLGVVCRRCAGALPDGAAVPGEVCGDCHRQPPPVRLTLAALAYEYPVDRLVQRLKFDGRLPVARALADCLFDRVGQAYAGDVMPEVLVPVPLHRQRQRQRGFNQAERIAARLSRRLRLPLDTRHLQRTRHTDPQSEQDLTKRRRNLAGAFRAVAPRHAHVALVDDVCTTGSTLRAAAIALREAGVARVDAWVIARKL